MKLIVGLGNPGNEYVSTRHNIGFLTIDNYLGEVNWKKQDNYLIYETLINEEKVIFIKPQTFMNLSGLAVKKVVNFYKIAISDILVIQDDLDLELGKYKLKRNSSSGGHNGIKSIIEALKSDAFLRLKIGISKDKSQNIIDYVLGKMSKRELEMINQNMDIYQDIIKCFIQNGALKTLETFNKR